MERIGIVGGGITGLTCAYKLQEFYDITLFEKDAKLGGQAQTHYVNGVSAEAAVSVMSKLTYPEFYGLMNEIGFDKLENYELTGLHVHDRAKTKLYIDVNPRRFLKLFPKFIKDTPLGIYRVLQLLPFVYRLYSDHRKGKLENKLVLDAYTLYPQYTHQITSVLSLLSLITAVSIKHITISHVLNFAFDFKRNPKKLNPITYLLKLFIDTDAPKNGVNEYIQLLKQSTKANFIENTEVHRVIRNTDNTVSVLTGEKQEHRFEKVIIAAQPFQISAFLEYKNDEEKARFESLAKMVTYTLVTNHQDAGIIDKLEPAEGLVDFRLDHHENCSQVTITRDQHFYTAQTLPDSFTQTEIAGQEYIDTSLTPDNYSIKADKILTQHIHGTPHMCAESYALFNKVINQSGQDNLYFACAALSDYPTSQEGGIRSALAAVKAIKAS